MGFSALKLYPSILTMWCSFPPWLEKDRRVTQGELEHMRDVFEGEIVGLKEELRTMVSHVFAYRAARSATRVLELRA